MKIDRLREERSGDAVRAVARVRWEDSDRPDREIYFESNRPAGENLSASADAFLLVVFPFAFRHREKRVALQGSVCPVLRNGVVAAMKILREWYEPSRPLAAIEASEGFQAARAARTPAAASVFSGGLDSLFTLRRNLLEIPRDHPLAIRDLIYAIGHDHPLERPDRWPPEAFYERIQESLARVAEAAGLRLVRTRLNMRDLDGNYRFLNDEYFGAELAAVGHAFRNRYSALYIPSSFSIGALEPNGSHLLLDQNYSSSALTVRHDGAEFTRIEKARLIADWDVAMECLRVCHATVLPAGFPNCGVCEKCLRTRVALLVIGRLDAAPTFPPGDVTSGELDRIGWTSGFEGWWGELLDGTISIGRHDLARVIEKKISAARRFRRWRHEEDWRGLLKRIDRGIFGGRVRRAIRAVTRLSRAAGPVPPG